MDRVLRDDLTGIGSDRTERQRVGRSLIDIGVADDFQTGRAAQQAPIFQRLQPELRSPPWPPTCRRLVALWPRQTKISRQRRQKGIHTLLLWMSAVQWGRRPRRAD